MSIDSDRNARIIERGLQAIAFACVLAAILHAVWPTRVDEKTAMFLGMAAIILIIREVSKLEFPGVKLERIRQELKEDVQQVDRKVELIEDRAMLPGRTGSVPTRLAAATASRGSKSETWDSDPNKGQFGGSATSNHRILKAEISPANGSRSAACTIELRVESTDPKAHPLNGVVTFHLHPTFGKRERFDVPVLNGVATDEITSWGVFTVGAVADDGKTKLELDLKDVPGGTKKFYAQ